MLRTLVTALVLSVIPTAFAGWSSSGPTGGAVNAVVVAPSDPSVIWAGNNAGVFRSTDGGATWIDVSGPVAEVDALVVHPNDPNKAWVLTGSFPVTHVYRTTDGGATWIDSTDGLQTIRPTALLLDPRDPDTLYVSSDCMPLFAKPPVAESVGGPGVFKSTDGGATWQASYGGGNAYANCVAEMAIDPFSPWRLFFSGLFGRQESYDSGNHWETPNGLRPTRAIVFDARYPFTHYGISSGDMFVSQDGGFTWALEATPPGAPRALSMDPENSRIFLGTDNGVWRSANGGTVWARTSLQAPRVNALDFGGVPAALFAATVNGLYELVDRGLGESRLVDLHDRAADVVAIAVDPSDPNVVYAGVQPAFLPGSPRGRIFRSTNAGASWERLPNDDESFKAAALTVDAAGTLYAGANAGPLYRRLRGEETWTAIYGKFSDVAADPKNPGTVFLSTGTQTLRSRDSGATWSVVLDGSGRLLIDPSDSRWVFAGSYRSSDGGNTWTLLPDFSTGVSSIDQVVIAPSNGAVMVRIGNRNGWPVLQRSVDRGATWEDTSNPSTRATAVAVDPRNDKAVWVVTNGVLYQSTDRAGSLRPVDGPFPTAVPPRLLLFDPLGRVLHAAYPQHGVWELSLEPSRQRPVRAR